MLCGAIEGQTLDRHQQKDLVTVAVLSKDNRVQIVLIDIKRMKERVFTQSKHRRAKMIATDKSSRTVIVKSKDRRAETLTSARKNPRLNYAACPPIIPVQASGGEHIGRVVRSVFIMFPADAVALRYQSDLNILRLSGLYRALSIEQCNCN